MDQKTIHFQQIFGSNMVNHNYLNNLLGKMNVFGVFLARDMF